MSMLLHYALEEQMKREKEQRKAKAERPVEVPEEKTESAEPVKKTGGRRKTK